jgi:hypothetical protein
VIRFALGLLAACGTASNPGLDGNNPGGEQPIGSEDLPGDELFPYRHTIALDGNDDFAAGEQFPTTSGTFTARVTWDEASVYVGYSGPDLDPASAGSATKWLFVYVDFDPGAASGGTTSLRYNTQQAVFPTGFGAELYARWKCDTTLRSIEQRQPDDTYTTVDTLLAGQSGTFVEFAIPRALLGGTPAIGLVTWMINEQDGAEGSFAGLYGDNFTDGYGPALPLTGYVKIDFTSPLMPNDPLNRAP